VTFGILFLDEGTVTAGRVWKQYVNEVYNDGFIVLLLNDCTR